MSNRLAPTAMSSMPQQAVANGIGHRLYFRHQFTTESSVVIWTFSGTSGASAGLSARVGPTGARCDDGVKEDPGVPNAIRRPLFAMRTRKPRPGSR